MISKIKPKARWVKKLKKGLSCCAITDCVRCPYKDTEYHGQVVSSEALWYIQYLERKVQSLTVSLHDKAPEVRHGEWGYRITSGYYTCSVCNADCWLNYEYCPHCGSLMGIGRERNATD